MRYLHVWTLCQLAFTPEMCKLCHAELNHNFKKNVSILQSPGIRKTPTYRFAISNYILDWKGTLLAKKTKNWLRSLWHRASSQYKANIFSPALGKAFPFGI